MAVPALPLQDFGFSGEASASAKKKSGASSGCFCKPLSSNGGCKGRVSCTSIPLPVPETLKGPNFFPAGTKNWMKFVLEKHWG